MSTASRPRDALRSSAEKWIVWIRRISMLCNEGRIPGSAALGFDFAIDAKSKQSNGNIKAATLFDITLVIAIGLFGILTRTGKIHLADNQEALFASAIITVIMVFISNMEVLTLVTVAIWIGVPGLISLLYIYNLAGSQ